MNFSIGIVDEEGNIKKLVINEKLLVELNKKLRTEGITEVHTRDDNGNLKTYKVQAIIQMAKGCKGHMMFIPTNEQYRTDNALERKCEVLKIRESYLRGYKIEMHNGEWVFSDTKESTVATWQKRPCGHCGKYNTIEGHDGCLGTLPGVMNACCGHGQENDAYVQFLDGFSIHGKDAATVMQILKNHSKKSEMRR